MKYLSLLILLYIVTSPLAAQTCTVSTLKFKPGPKYFNRTDSTLKYPVVAVKDKKVSEKINSLIRSELIDAEYSELSVQDAMRASLENGLTSMSYNITFNREGIFSLTVDAESCGAYCSGWSRYLNFDLNTGEALTLDDLLKNGASGRLKEMVYADKVNAIHAYKKEMSENLSQKGIDSSDYRWAMGEVDGHCINTIRMDAFSLTDSTLEIKDRCEFPHAIQSQAPFYELRYNYKQLVEYIRESYLAKLIGN